MIRNICKQRNRSSLQGISLIESVLYLGIFSVLFSLILNYALAVGENNRKASIKNTLGRADIFLSEHFEESIEEALSIDEANSSLSVDNGILRLNNASGYLEYRISNGRILVDINGVTNFLTENSLEVTKLRFDKIVDDDSNTIGVKLDVDIRSDKDKGISRDIKIFFSF